MALVNPNKVTKGQSATPSLKKVSKQPEGTANMPRVGGLTTNYSTKVGDSGGAR